MQVIIDTEKGLTETDRMVLKSLLGITETASGVLMASEAKPAASPDGVHRGPNYNTETDLPKPAKKAAAKKATSGSAKKVAEAPAPSEPAEDSEVADSPAQETSVTMDDVKKRVNELMESGQRDDVVAALAVVGVKRVSLLTEDKFAAFMDALN